MRWLSRIAAYWRARRHTGRHRLHITGHHGRITPTPRKEKSE